MKFISESVLDDLDVKSTDSAAEVAASDSYQNTIHPSEYQYCLMLYWDDRIEDILNIYSTRYNIYHMDSREDINRISTLITFNISAKGLIDWIEERGMRYVIVEFDSETPWVPILRLLGLSNGGLKFDYIEWFNPHTAIYIQKNQIIPSVSDNIKKLMRGELGSSNFREIVVNGVYRCCNDQKEFNEELENCVRDYVVKMDVLWKKKKSVL